MNPRALLSAAGSAAGWAAVAALALTVFLGFWQASRSAEVFLFETEVVSSVAGRAQLYFDRGDGLSEQKSVSQPIAAGQPERLRFALPGGRYRGLRFDPIDRAATVTFSPPQIVTRAGTVVHRLEPARWTPNDQIEHFAPDARARMVARAGVNDPYLTVAFAPELSLALTSTQRAWEARATLFAAALLGWGLLFVVGCAWLGREEIGRWAMHFPRVSIVAVAAVAALVAAYPVVFAGKSFVSPNTAPLVRQGLPSIPGQQDLTQTDLRTPDPAVMLWQNVPYSVIQHEAVFRHGELPLWNRYSSAGVTLLGQGQSMAGDPLHLLVIAANGAAWAWDAKFVLARVVFAAGLGLVVWTMTLSLRAALLTALAAPFVGYFNFRFNHPAIFSFAYAPWILLGWARWVTRDSTRSARTALATLVLANLIVLASGTVKEAYALMLVLNAVGLLAWLSAPRPQRRASLGRDAVLLLLAGAATILISAPLWLTFFSTLRDATTAYENPVVWQAPRWFAIGLLDSLFFVELHAKHWGYLGSANLLFALGALGALRPLARGRHLDPASRRFGWAVLAGILSCVALAFSFVPADWIARVPLLRSIYHVHNTFSTPAVVLLCVLGGLGLHGVSTHSARWPSLVAAVVGGLLLVVYFRGQPEAWQSEAGWLGWIQGILAHRFFVLNLALGVMAMGVLLVCSRRYPISDAEAGGPPAVQPTGLRGPRWARPPFRQSWLAVATTAALVVLLYRHGLHVPLGLGDTYLTHPMPRGQLHAPSPAMTAAQRDASGVPFRLAGTELNVVNGWNAIYGVESINGPDALVNRHYRELALAAGVLPRDDWRIGLAPHLTPTQQAWLDLVGVRYLASDRTLEEGGLSLMGEFELRLYRNARAWPRAFHVPHATRHSSPADLIEQVRTSAGPLAAWDAADPEAGEALAAFSAPAAAQATATPATDYRLTSNTTTFRVRAPSRGVVVLQETWLPGDFEVTLNGRAVPYYRINHAFKAITVPEAGDHVITFRYWPRTFTLSLWFSGVGLALVIVLLTSRRWFPVLARIDA